MPGLVNATQQINQTVIDNITNITSLGDFAIKTNDFMGGAIGVSILLILFTITFVSMVRKVENKMNAFTASLFFTSIVAMMLRAVPLVSDKVMWGAIILTAISVSVQLMFRPEV